jgi:pyridoxal/pyridoxine/pyridoxamine kinase
MAIYCLDFQEQPPEQFKIEIPKIPAYFTGTGDLTTALLLGWSNKYPDNLERAAELAVSSLQVSQLCCYLILKIAHVFCMPSLAAWCIRNPVSWFMCFM